MKANMNRQAQRIWREATSGRRIYFLKRDMVSELMDEEEINRRVNNELRRREEESQRRNADEKQMKLVFWVIAIVLFVAYWIKGSR